MAIDLCSEIISSTGISPRISFSHDLNQTDLTPIDHHHHHARLDASFLDSGSDFNFCINGRFLQEFSSADELFSNGKILPVQIKKINVIKHEVRQSESIRPPPPRQPQRLKELLNFDADEEKPPMAKPFWQFRRSNSLNCDNGRSKSLLWSLQFLSRSNSTGSSLNLKQSVAPKETQKQNLQKQSSSSSTKSESSFSAMHCSYNSSQKRPWKKNCGSYNGNGVRISPVLNFPPPYISRATVSFFGFGSLFCYSKAKKKKR